MSSSELKTPEGSTDIFALVVSTQPNDTQQQEFNMAKAASVHLEELIKNEAHTSSTPSSLSEMYSRILADITTLRVHKLYAFLHKGCRSRYLLSLWSGAASY
jgi:hypothetical protein